MKYGIAILSSIPMRREPAEQSEMVSQLLFGECYSILSEGELFFLIQTLFDDYTGWIDRKMHYGVSQQCCDKCNKEWQRVQTARLMTVNRPGIPSLQLLPGSTLPGLSLKNNTLEIDEIVFHINEIYDPFENTGSIIHTAARFLNAPYLWGGRSIFGCDCSGFTQVVFKMHGIKLRRDAFQQAEQGIEVPSVSLARAGDLAFFAKPDKRITHVGIILSSESIIHNSGYVRIDRLDHTGIYNTETGQHTHFLISIRRISNL